MKIRIKGFQSNTKFVYSWWSSALDKNETPGIDWIDWIELYALTFRSVSKWSFKVWTSNSLTWFKQFELYKNKSSLFHSEQEIMYLSTKYLASPLSSWSQTVFLDRKAMGITDDESILSILLPNVTDLPELWWLFPEGDQDNH